MKAKRTLCIIGGGAAGLFLAARLASQNIRIVILERAARCGKKILASGNGRCNLSNLRASTNLENYSDSSAAQAILNSFTHEATLEFFSQIGLETRCEGDRIYPLSDSATSVLDVLRKHNIANGVEEHCGFSVSRVEKSGGGFLLVSTDERTFFADFVAVAVGSPASTASSFELSHLLLGEKTNDWRPVLTPLPCREKIAPLRGIRAKASLSCPQLRAAPLHGELLFKDTALSGILVFELSFLLAKYDSFPAKIFVDLMPETPLSELEKKLDKRHSEDILLGMFHSRLNQYILNASEFEKTKDKKQLAKCIKALEFNVDAQKSTELAQVCKGGLPLERISLETMETKAAKNLFAIGESVDLFGQCGGFNLQLCWSQAAIAANAIKERL